MEYWVDAWQADICGFQQKCQFHFLINRVSILFLCLLQRWPSMRIGQLYTWSLILEHSLLYDFAHWRLTGLKMEEEPGLPNVSIPSHDEQRDKKKRYTVCSWVCTCLLCGKGKCHLCYNCFLSVLLFQVYKVIVSVGPQEWFVFRRYAEFDKLYNTVSWRTRSFLLKLEF